MKHPFFHLPLFLIPLAAVSSTLTLISPEDHLIGPSGTERKISISILNTDGPAQGGELRGLLRPYEDNGTLSPDIVATFTAPVAPASAANGTQTAGVLTVSLPTPGLYQLDIRHHDHTGRQIGGYLTTLASIPERNGPNPDDWGVCTHFAHGKGTLPRSLELVQLAGFSRIRDEVYWQHVEQTPGKFEFPPYADAWIHTARELGLSPLIILAYGNARAWPDEFAGNNGFPANDKARALFVRYVREMVTRYQGVVKHWEVWNEPHSWGKASPEIYTPLLKEVYPAIKAIDPTATVISCGGGGAGGGPGGDYISGVLKHGGLDYQDAFSVHPYMSPYDPETGYGAQGAPIPRVNVPAVWSHLRQFSERNPRSDQKRLEVWTTEIGWPSHLTRHPPAGEVVQAAFLTRTLLLSRRHPAMKAVFIYDFQDDGNNPLNQEHNFGLITTEYAPKPSWVSIATLAGVLGNRPWVRSLVENAQVHVHQYGQLPDGVIAAWAVGFETQTVTLALPPGTYVRRDWQGRGTPVIVGHTGQLELEVSPLPVYLIPQP
ncbi:alpha-L-arabinofuranosidase [Opitutaceae bacterium TAV1]|nr:alpha-L-arabinofuranosidase [Opitutaceae bacterium TAV1]